MPAASGACVTCSDQDLTLTDAVGLHVMRELAITACWSTDFHLGLTGVTLVVDEH